MFNKVRDFMASVGGKLIFSYVSELVVGLVLKRINKFGDAIDWEKVEIDGIALIREKVPSYFLEEICIAIFKVFLKQVQETMKDLLTCELLKLALKKGDMKEATKLIMSKIQWKFKI